MSNNGCQKIIEELEELRAAVIRLSTNRELIELAGGLWVEPESEPGVLIDTLLDSDMSARKEELNIMYQRYKEVFPAD